MRSLFLPAVLSLIIAALILSAGCTGTMPAPAPSGHPPAASPAAPAATPVKSTAPFTLKVNGIADGSILPSDYTCTVSAPDSPSVSWENVPAGTKTLALIVDDPDAPSGTFTHWIVFNIPPERGSIPRGITAVKEIAGGGQQGQNSADGRGYYPACPPIGPVHRYVFTLYAVDYSVGMPTADRDGIDAALAGHVVGKAAMTAQFRR